MSQPPPASTDSSPRTSRKNARAASASFVNTIAWMPVIMVSPPRSWPPTSIARGVALRDARQRRHGRRVQSGRGGGPGGARGHAVVAAQADGVLARGVRRNREAHGRGTDLVLVERDGDRPGARGQPFGRDE